VLTREYVYVFFCLSAATTNPANHSAKPSLLPVKAAPTTQHRQRYSARVLLLLICALVTSATFSATSSADQAATVVLFLPAQHSMEWILTEHYGAKGFRSGDTCQKCHGGNEQALSSQPIINLETRFAVAGDSLLLDLAWTGGPTAIMSVMLDPGNARAFARAGCWAACHDDIRGMQGSQEKYLGQTRLHMTAAGGGTDTKDSASLAAMQTSQNYIQILQLDLQDGTLASASSGTILATKTLEAFGDNPTDKASASWAAGRWQAKISLPLPAASTTLDFALVEHKGSTTQHYVSLPHELLKSNDGYGLKVE
jgi:hypothetical protein